MRCFLLILFLALCPFVARAVEVPAGQEPIDMNKILRGHFTEDLQTKNTQNPIHTSGHFVVAPRHGLIWGLEKPFPTLTILTPNGAAQDIGGVAIKLPTKNFHHLYDMVGGALAGNWKELETDFVITRRDTGQKWHMLLMPRLDDKPKLPYASITVSGSRFVEKIVMTQENGRYDLFDFTDEDLSNAPLTTEEMALFNEVVP